MVLIRPFIQTQTIVYRRRDKGLEFLALRRTFSKGGVWQPITGGYKPKDKDILNTSLREVYEETGLCLADVFCIIPEFDSFKWGRKDREDLNVTLNVNEICFGIEVSPNSRIVLSHEHDKYVWDSYCVVREMYKYESNRKSLDKLNELLN